MAVYIKRFIDKVADYSDAEIVKWFWSQVFPGGVVRGVVVLLRCASAGGRHEARFGKEDDGCKGQAGEAC